MIEFDQFTAVDMRVGRIVAVDDFPEARVPAWKLTIDFGPELGERRSSAQITGRYAARDLIGMQVCAVVNFPVKRIAGFESQVLVLGLDDDHGNVVLVSPTLPVPNGRRLY